MKDFLGQELNVGSEVVLIEPGYRNLLKGRVIALTPQKVRVKLNGRATWQQKDTIIDPNTCVKVGGQ